jgi:hypothetical protein
MRLHLIAPAVAAVAVAALSLTACGGGDDDQGSGDGGGDTEATTAAAVATDAPGDTAAASDDPPTGDFDCDALQPAIETVGLGWQIYPQLATQESVDNWATPLLDVDAFGAGLEALRALEPLGPDVAGALDQMTQANDIARRGVSGDAAAQAEIDALFGEAPLDALIWVGPVAEAYGLTGCPEVG